MAQSSGRGTGAEDEEGITPPAENFAELRLPIHRALGPWVRLHWREYGAIYFGKKRLHRFDDPQGEYGVLYLAEDEHGAFVETFGRNPEKRLRDRLVAESEIRRRHLCEVSTEEELSFVDLTGAGASMVGVTGAISTDPHSVTRSYSRAIHDHPQRPDGIRYRLRYDLDRMGVAIFERALEDRDARLLPRGSLLDPQNGPILGVILDNYNLGLG